MNGNIQYFVTLFAVCPIIIMMIIIILCLPIPLGSREILIFWKADVSFGCRIVFSTTTCKDVKLVFFLLSFASCCPHSILQGTSIEQYCYIVIYYLETYTQTDYNKVRVKVSIVSRSG